MEYRLDELFDLQMGKTPSRNKTEYWSDRDNKWVAIGDLSKCEKYIEDTKEYISDLAVEESGISIIPEGTVIMSFKLSIGKTAITSEPMYSNEAIMSFRDKHVEKLIPDYVYYLFKARDWDAGTNKAVMGKTLNKATLSEIRIKVHDYDKQKKIVSTLDKVQAIKDMQQAELDKLDSLIKARFVELFGDPSNSKGYPIVKVQEVAEIQVGVVIKPAQYYTDAEHGVKAFRSLNIGEITVKDDDWVYFNEEGQKKNSKSILKENDLVIVRSGAPGTACVVTKQFEGCNAVDVIIAHPNMAKVNPYYLCAFTNYPHGKIQIEAGTGGAAQQHFNVGKYKDMDLIYPPKKEQDEFVSFMKKIDKSRLEVQKALDETQLLMDSLMQEYFG